MHTRRVAITIPARNEAERLGSCLAAIGAMPRDPRVSQLTIMVLANNCTDETAAVARAAQPLYPVLVKEHSIPAAQAHAGWARRLALDAAADELDNPTDLLMTTDADTRVACDWMSRTLDYLDEGYTAVAGFARLDPLELRGLPWVHRQRISAIRRYEMALDHLKQAQPNGEPGPRHFYEGGASIALTLGAYRAIGGAPTPPVGEDKALFEALRQHEFKIRHPRDVVVKTSCRLEGRAPGGAADTLSGWGKQGEDDGLWGVSPLKVALRTSSTPQALKLADLPSETARARHMVRALRDAQVLAMSGTQPMRRQRSSL